MIIEVLTKKGNYFEVKVKSKRVVCPSCEGEGTELRGGLKGLAISEEALQDDDFREAYFGGGYDVACSHCEGKRVVDAVDEEALSKKMFARWEKALIEKQRFEAEVRAERAGGF
jgi:predicted methyltransferase